MRTPFLLAPVVGLLLGGGADELTKRDVQRLQGTWTPISSERAGKARPEADLKKHGVKMVFQGDTFAVTAGGKDEAKGTFKLASSKKPRQIDLVVAGPDGKSVTIPGIYELEGDTLTLATGRPGQERPAAFKTKENSPQETSVFKRLRK